MSLRKLEGFDHYDYSQMEAKHTTVTRIDAATGFVIGRYGGKAFYLSNLRNYIEDVYDNQVTWAINFAFNTAANGVSQGIIQLYDGATLQCDLRLNASRQWYVTRNGTLLGSAGSTIINLNQWYWMGFKVTIDNSAGAFAVQIDGATEISGSSLDTSNSGNAYANTVRVGSVNAGQLCTIDDMVTMDGQGSAFNDLITNRRIWPVRPIAAGTHTDWTGTPNSNWINVHDIIQPNDDASFNYTGTAGNKDTFGFDKAPIDSGSIDAIQHNIYAKHDGGARSIRSISRISGTDYAGATQALTSGWKYYTEVEEVNPDTSAAYTKAGFDGGEYGYELVS